MSVASPTFGELRSMMQTRRPDDFTWANTLRALVRRAMAHDPTSVLDEWVPYMRGFADAWGSPFDGTRCESLDEYRVWPGVIGERRYALELRNQPIGDEGGFTIEAAPATGRMSSFTSYRNQMSSLGLEALERARDLDSVSWLQLGWDTIEERGAAALERRIASMPGLRRLELTSLSFGDASTARVVRSCRHRGMTWMDLVLVGAGRQTLDALLEGAGYEDLWQLGLSGATFGDEGVARLSRSSALPCLRRIRLNHTKMNGGGVRALLESQTLPRLETIWFEGNPVPLEDQRELSALAAQRGVTVIFRWAETRRI